MNRIDSFSHFFDASSKSSYLASGCNASVSSPVKYDYVPDDTVEKVLDMYYSSPDGDLPRNNSTKYLTKDCPPEVRDLVEQRVLKSLPSINGLPEDVASAVPVRTRGVDNIHELQQSFIDSLRSSFESQNTET